MATSQHTFESRIGRFKNGDVLVQGWLDYASANPLITKAALTTFISDVDAANGLVNTTSIAVDNARDQRNPLVFKLKDTNPLCLEARLQAIANYVSGEFKPTSAASKAIRAVLKKINPKYKKVTPVPGEEPAKTRSTAEASFTSMVGHGNTVIAIITALGVAYLPPDNNLKIPAMQTLVTQILDLNKLVAQKLEPLGNAEKARKKLYDGEGGMDDRIQLIKNYLGSFSPPKKHSHYIEYAQAIKGV